MTEEIQQIVDNFCDKKKDKEYVNLTVNPKIMQRIKKSVSICKHIKKFIFLALIICVVFGFFVFLISKTHHLSFELKNLYEENEKIVKFSHNYKQKIIDLLKVRQGLKK